MDNSLHSSEYHRGETRVQARLREKSRGASCIVYFRAWKIARLQFLSSTHMCVPRDFAINYFQEYFLYTGQSKYYR